MLLTDHRVQRCGGQFSCSAVSDSLQLHGLQHASLPCLSPAPGACSNSCPSSWWCRCGGTDVISKFMEIFLRECFIVGVNGTVLPLRKSLIQITWLEYICISLRAFCPYGSDSKVSPWNEGVPVLIRRSGRFPGEKNGYPLQYSCQENPMDRGIWWAIVHRVTKSWTWLSDEHFHFQEFFISKWDTSQLKLAWVRRAFVS